jgi:hypothetical protein
MHAKAVQSKEGAQSSAPRPGNTLGKREDKNNKRENEKKLAGSVGSISFILNHVIPQTTLKKQAIYIVSPIL